MLTWFAFFAPLAAGRTHFVNDIKKLYYPLEVAYAEAQQSGNLPVWNPYFGFGQPLLAWGQLGFFTPVHIILRLLHVSPLALLQVSMVLYHGLGIGGMYLWLRRYRLAPLPAATGSVVYVFSGFHLGHLTHVNFYVATMVLPWFLLAIFDIVHQRRIVAIAWGALALGAILVSGHMQIAVYTVSVGALYAIVEATAAVAHSDRPARRLLTLLTCATVTIIFGLLLSAPAIAPLWEFWSQTDRSAPLTPEELYDFSYPPTHAITLIAPFFFGDYHSYWGAKNFAELSGYTGLVPLLASGVALVAWRPRRLVAFAICLVVVCLIIGLGVYSPIYRSLVNAQLITSAAVPARLLLFFDTAIAILASCGLNALTATRSARTQRFWISGAVMLPLVILLPFIWHLGGQPAWVSRLRQQLTGSDGIFLALGILVFALAIRARSSTSHVRYQTMIMLVVATSLVIVGWRYNPVTPARSAYAPSLFAESLQNFHQQTLSPARLYTRSRLMVADRGVDQPLKRTDPISQTFTVHQPLFVAADNLTCLVLSVESEQRADEPVRVALYTADREQLLREVLLTSDTIVTGNHRACFDPLPESGGKTYLITFTSAAANSGLRLLYGEPAANSPRASFIRVAQPTRQHIEQSRKNAQLILTPYFQPPADPEVTGLSPHLNVTAGASAAGWIGSLADLRFQQFTERHLRINDDLVDGDGNHALLSHRGLFDAAGITHFIQSVPPHHDDLLLEHNFILKQEVPQGDSLVRLYENPQAVPKAYLAAHTLIAASDTEAELLLLQHHDRLAQTVILQGPSAPALSSLPSAAPSVADITEFDFNRITVVARTDQPAILVLTELANPQWQVAVDGQPAEMLIANTLWRAVAVPAGTHTVTFWYDSPATARGLKAGAAALVILSLIICASLATARNSD